MQVVVVLLDLKGHRRLVLSWSQVRADAGRDNNQEEYQEDQWKPDSYHPPVIQKVERDLAGAAIAWFKIDLHQKVSELR